MRTDSRYISADKQFTQGNTYDKAGELIKVDGEPTREVHQSLYRLPVLPLPESPDRTQLMTIGDTYPLIAKRELNDSEKWWIIAEANTQIRHPLDLKPNDVIFIP